MFTTPKTQVDISRASRAIIERFASRAYRRPVGDGEITKLMKLVELAIAEGRFVRAWNPTGGAGDAGFTAVSFPGRAGSRGQSRRQAGETARGEVIGDFELASRLSYFLWSSMPDDELWRVAVDGSLRSAEVLDKQVRRMLRDAKAQALVENFAGQWLQLRNLRAFNPDRGRFPNFDESCARR